jgi:exo-beta-1,3-glucanase (GH17 family)
MSPQNSLQNTSPKTLWRYGFFNLILLILLGGWYLHQNQPVTLPAPQLPVDGKLQCISYSPYYGEDQTPLLKTTRISTAQIDQDLQLLAQRFQCVRIYSVSQGLDYVPQAASRLGLKVLLGAWIGWVKADNDKELTLAIKLANLYPDTVKGLVVGNEVLLRREQTEAAMQAYLARAKRETKVPVTYADVWEFWLKHKGLEKSVDFITVHVLPYWEDDPQSIENAVHHADYVMTKVSSTFAKPIFIGETGWPSIGRQRGESIPSQINQARYLREFLQMAQTRGWNYNLIEAIDQPWKRLLEGTVGGYWGLYSTDLQPKFDFTGPVAERHDGWQPLYWALAGMFIFGGLAMRIVERRPGALFAMLSLGAFAGATVPLQINYLLTACRNATEWLALGGMALTGWLALISLCFVITRKPHAPSPSAKAEKLMRICLSLLGLGAAITGYLLMHDGRYRDFPLVIYALPVLQLSLGMWLAGIGTRTTWRAFYVLNTAMMVTALACLWTEPNNLHALLWAGLAVLLIFASWPKRNSKNLEQPAMAVTESKTKID